MEYLSPAATAVIVLVPALILVLAAVINGRKAQAQVEATPTPGAVLESSILWKTPGVLARRRGRLVLMPDKTLRIVSEQGETIMSEPVADLTIEYVTNRTGLYIKKGEGFWQVSVSVSTFGLLGINPLYQQWDEAIKNQGGTGFLTPPSKMISYFKSFLLVVILLLIIMSLFAITFRS